MYFNNERELLVQILADFYKNSYLQDDIIIFMII